MKDSEFQLKKDQSSHLYIEEETEGVLVRVVDEGGEEEEKK